MDLYVYYRVRNELVQQLQPRVLAMQAGLAKRHGIASNLKRRPEEKNGEQTWMETYHATPAGFGEVIEQAALAAGLAEFTSGARHTEVFMDLPPCA